MSAKTKVEHTLGPWHVKLNPIHHAVRAHNLQYVAEHIRGASEAECRANANLIAAAPDLLDALRALLDYVEEDNPGGAKADAWIAGLCDASRAAIARAEN